MLVKSSRLRAQDRNGTTLQEMLVVMAILVSLAGTGWPALRGGLEKAQIRDGAKQVRTELAKTRLTAIESGVAHTFRYQAESGQFEVAPFLQGSDDQEFVDSGDSDQDGERPETLELTLADGVVFSPKPSKASSLDDLVGTDLIVEDEESTDISEEGWSAPIVFHPNGRTSNARITLQNEAGYFIEVTLRGLTGTATVGDMKRLEVEK